MKTQEQTKWFVITGGACCGKSKLIEALAFLGHAVRPEAARLYIDEEMSKGLTLAAIRKNELQFQTNVIALKAKAEATTDKNQLVFWDRGMPDSNVYLRFCGGDTQIALKGVNQVRYQAIFFLESLSNYEKDYARNEDAARSKAIHEALYAEYEALGYSVIRVPVLPISQRVAFILKHVS